MSSVPTQPIAGANKTPAQSDTRSPRVHYAHGTISIYAALLLVFVVLLLLSNLGAQKLVPVGSRLFDASAILFPITYVIGDVLSEVYGFKSARRAIFIGFVVSVFASLTFAAMVALPADDPVHQIHFAAVLGQVWRFVAASMLGYLAGQLVNAYVLTWIKDRWGDKQLWVRLVSSTVVGELADTFVFCFVAWLGVETMSTILNLTITGVWFKILVEVLVLPITYTVIRHIKKKEGI